MSKLLLVFFFSLFLTLTLHAQTSVLVQSVLEEQFVRYSRSHPTSLLYVHTDKTIYTNNETIWFSGYLMKSKGSQSSDHTILSVVLMREDSRKIELENKYVIENGLSFGSLTLPDTIPPGNYQFIASTNVLAGQQPVALFTQSLTLKSITHSDFTAELSLLDTVITNGMLRAKVTVNVKYPDPKKKLKVSMKYSVGKDYMQSVVLQDNNYIISIPAASLNQLEPVLLTTITYNNQEQHLNIRLPEINSQGIQIRFYPEGGYLVSGQESTVGWDARTKQDLPVALTGILCQNNKPIDTLTTTSYGIGTFRLKPDAASSYTLRVAANPYQFQDTTYQLPKAIQTGVTLHLDQAIVKDTLQVTITGKETEPVQVMVYNDEKIYASFTAQPHPKGKKLSLVLGPEIPKALTTITLLNTQGRPVADRLFFAHYDQGITAGIRTDKQTYNRREQVSVKLKLTDNTGQPAQGIMSIAVIQDNRIEGSKVQDIESYVYLHHELGMLPQNPLGRNITNKDYLEDMLLIKVRRRYTWQSLMSSSVADSANFVHIRSPVIKGQIKYNNKLLKKPVVLSIVSGSRFNLITTEVDGSFVLEADKLFTTYDRKVLIAVNKGIKDGYSIDIDDPFMKINEKLTKEIEIKGRGGKRVENTKEQELKEMERVIALKAVIINGTKSNDLLFGISAGTNACGDYVCSQNTLNCPIHVNHKLNRKPVKGQLYTKIPNTNEQIVYSGCAAEEGKIFTIKGIYTAREFYGVATDAASIYEPQFLSTLYWKPGVVPNNQGETEVSFFTGDITGKFRIVIQGVGEKDVIYGESSFMIK